MADEERLHRIEWDNGVMRYREPKIGIVKMPFPDQSAWAQFLSLFGIQRTIWVDQITVLDPGGFERV